MFGSALSVTGSGCDVIAPEVQQWTADFRFSDVTSTFGDRQCTTKNTIPFNRIRQVMPTA